MTGENSERVRRAYEAFNRGDLEGMVADFAAEFEYVATGTVPGAAGVYRGPEGWTEFVMGWFASEFDDPRVVIHELTNTGDGVLAAVTLQGRGKKSGVEASWDVWHLWTFRDAKLVRGKGFTTSGEAFQAAGLLE